MPPTKANIVWKPIKGTSQELALDSRAHHTLYTGSRGPGKSEIQLMRFRRRVGLGYGPFWRGIIFDREYKHLDDLVSKSKRLFTKFGDGAKFLESPSSYKWVWPTGEELLFRQIKKAADYDNYHGQEYPYIGWNELTKYPTLELYDMMMSCNRSSFTPEKDSPRNASGEITNLLPEIPLEVFATCNSYGPGHGPVKARFIDPAPYGKIVKHEFTVFNPKTQREETIVRTQVAIFGSYKENIYLDPVYVAGLDSITDENLRKSWLFGSWDVVAGGAFDDVWRRHIHVLPRFVIPETWYLDRTFDWGSTHPFSVGWWAESNGDEATLPDGRKFCPKKGSLIRFREWYGCHRDSQGKMIFGSNKGIKMAAKNIADGIKDIEIAMMKAGWICRQPGAGPADNQIRDVKESDVDTIEKKMLDRGIRWQASDKSPGSRRIGLELVRGMMKNSIGNEGPGLYVMDNCLAFTSLVPVLPRDEDHMDDVDTSAEDHPYDETRYRVLKGSNRYATQIPVTFST